MTTTLEENSVTSRGEFDTDELRMPPMAFAKLVFEANQHAPLGPMGTGSEDSLRGMAIGVDRWLVGTEKRNGRRFYRVTVKGNHYGGGTPYQRVWIVQPEDVVSMKIEVRAVKG